MKIFINILLASLLISVKYRQQEYIEDGINFDSILNQFSNKESRNKQNYPEDYKLGEPATNKETISLIANKPQKDYVAKSTSLPGILNTKKESSGHDNDKSKSWKVFFILIILGFSIIVIHILIKTEFHYLPESIAVIFLGSIIGFLFQILSHWNIADWTNEETFSPTMFFLVLLPPIIFESGYSMHKGNFFENIGSICVFAIFGTAISAFVMGSGIYVFGQMSLTYELSAQEAFTFGSVVSAVDPVATLAIFNALDMDPILYMLVFGESILNDAVAIVLTNTIMDLSGAANSMIWITGYVIGRFFLMFFASALIGCLFGLLSALLFKYIDFRRTPSLETAFMFIFMYSPYAFAEALHLSGIMAILFAGIVMSHYTHYNLSSVTRITFQQIFRTLSFVSETCVFAYIGMAIFSFKHIFKPSLVILSILMCLVSRALNIFPLSLILNRFREHKITKKMQFIMWFSGLRGAIAFALSLNLELKAEARHVIITTTLILVIFTTIVLGGGTMPLMKFLNRSSERVKKRDTFVFFSKAKDFRERIEIGGIEQESQLIGDESDIQFVRNRVRLRGFVRIDEAIMKPLFIRKFTDEELKEGQAQMKNLTKEWFDDVNKDKGPLIEAEQTTNSKNKKKKSKNSKECTKVSNNKTYHNLNSTEISNIMLGTSEEDDDSEIEQVIIDKSKFSLSTNL